jgi:hypothetical protein
MGLPICQPLEVGNTSKMEEENPRDNALREMVADFIAAKAHVRDEAALVWLLQRTVATLLTLYPRERASEEIRRRVNQILPDPES